MSQTQVRERMAGGVDAQVGKQQHDTSEKRFSTALGLSSTITC